MNQNLGQTQTQRQELRLNGSQIQSLTILQTGIQELSQKIEAVVTQNPMLEITSYGNEVLATDLQAPADGRTPEEEQQDDKARLADFDENLGEALREDNDDYYDNFVADSFVAGRDVESEEKRRHFLESIHVDGGILDELRLEARTAAGDDRQLAAALRYVIASLDDNGYLHESDEEMAEASGLPAETFRRAVQILQGFDPPGIGARTLRECLLLQLARSHEEGSLAWNIVDSHLELLERNHLKDIAHAIGTADIDEIQKAVDRIRRLSPRPLAAFSDNDAQIIVPEAEVAWTRDGDLTVRMNKDALPKVVLSADYLALLDSQELDADTKAFLTNKKREARHFLQALDDRETTIADITRVIVREQAEFFRKGDLALRPLTMTDIAAAIGAHESTVSRALDAKYLMTPFGLRPYKFFFSAKALKGDSEDASSLVVRRRIADLIAAEDKRKPLSDSKISDILAKEGITVARRTIAKYREMENIRATSLRKMH